MLKQKFPSRTAVTAAIALALSAGAVSAEQIRYHEDHRRSAKLIIAPAAVQQKQAISGEALARDFLNRNAGRFGIRNLAELELDKVQESLTATHYHYAQKINGIPVLRGEAIVSIGKRDGQILRAFNNTYSSTGVAGQPAKTTLTGAEALDKAWAYLQGVGQLHFVPKVDLYYVDINGSLRLGYRTQLSATEPGGSWEHVIDAKTGEVLIARRLDLPRKTGANPVAYGDKWPAAAKNAAHRPLAELQAALQQQLAKEQQNNKLVLKANGSGKVFDPDPITTLGTDFVDDDVIPNGAYFTRTLPDITFNGATYTLVGPYVNIVNIEAPNTAPSTRADGIWEDIRENNGGSNAFNDAMTYFHLDQSQRYMQSLGFTGTTGIIQRPIRVDTDGANGADNSFYSPGNPDYLSFGHGCVDDNEDVDVILHEYGHAIQANINPNWIGGDTGAMGEGFGDYWAGSYSYSTPNGASGDYNKVYTWDGAAECWDGRRMDKTTYQYNPNETYPAHEQVLDVYSDELWSTPLFQALVALVDAGRSREEVDKIILESHFGLGANLKMPDLAYATIQAACVLYPTGPHAEVFRQKFDQVNIIDASANLAPVARVSAASISTQTGASVTLNASDSSDPDCEDITFSWTQTGGTSVSLSSSTAAAPTFTAPSSAGSLTFQVTVSDGTDADVATVTVNVRGTDSGGGGGGALGWLATAGLAGLLGLRVKRRQ